MVALLTEGVDRNHLSTLAVVELMRVALLTEGVDRNKAMGTYTAPILVALLTEGVDRNNVTARKTKTINRRPPHGGRG